MTGVQLASGRTFLVSENLTAVRNAIYRGKVLRAKERGGDKTFFVNPAQISIFWDETTT